MRKYLVLLFFTLITTLSFGQSNYQDVVYLKNGSIIRGIIIEQIPNKSIKIETADNNIFLFQINEIEKFTKEPIVKKHYSNKNSGFKPGYKQIVELAYQLGVGTYAPDRIKLNMIYSYQINPYFSFGLGTGLRYYHAYDTVLLPFFTDFRVYFIDNNISPYLSLGLGYSLNASSGFRRTGVLINPTVGVNIKLIDKYSINVGLGYEMQRVDPVSRNYSAISLNVGISF